nr:hypothetical protein [Tanacetum cinerariifolium]
MANVPSNDPNVDASAIVHASVNLDHASAQPVGLGNDFAPHWIGDNNPNNPNGWIEEDTEEEEKDPEEEEEDPEEDPEDDDDVMEMDDEAEVIDPYMDDGSNNPPPPNSKDEETPPTSPVIPDADGQPVPPIASFGQNVHFGESSSTANLLTGNSKIVPTGPMCLNLGMAWKRLGKMEKLMSERIHTERRVTKKFKEQDRHFVGLGCDNIKMDRTGSKVFEDKRALEKELVNERNVKEFYREFGEYMCRMLQNRQKSEGSFPLPLGSQVREPPAEPSTRPVPALYSDDPYVVTRDAAIAAAAVATFDIDDDDDDTAPMDSQPYEPRGSPRDTQTMPPRKSIRGNPHPLLTQDTVNRMIQESVEAAIRAERERERERENFMKCSPITFHGNEGAVEMKVMMTKEFCPPEEIQRMECELWNLRVKEMDISSYTTYFNELVILCPGMVPTERKKVKRRSSKNIKGEVTSSEPATLNKAMRMAHTLIEQKVKAIAEREADNKKKEWENFQGGSSGGGNNNSNQNNNIYNNNRNYNNNNHNNNQNQYRNPNQNHQNNQRQGNVRAMTNVGNQNINEAGKNVKCNKCRMQHYRNCPIKCNKCGKI